MSKISDNKLLGFILPATFFIAVALSAVAVIAFAMESNSLAIVFTALSAVAWVAIFIEFMMAYEAIVDRWFTKDRSIWAAVWFIVSAFLAIMLTPNRGWNWQTFVVPILIFIPLFLVPYYICLRYGSKLSKKLPHANETKLAENERQIEATLSAVTPPPIMKSDDERAHYDDLIGKLTPNQVKALPEQLQSNDALFLLILFREDGYLNQDFKPITIKEDGENNMTMAAYIADVICTALKIKRGKWTIFGDFWGIANPSQNLTNFKTKTKHRPTDHQLRIDKLLRKATRLRDKLDSEPLHEFMNLKTKS